MFNRILLSLIISLFLFLINTSAVSAGVKGVGDVCDPNKDICSPSSYSCQQYDSKTSLCLSRIIGAGEKCNTADPGTRCIAGYNCQFDVESKEYLCQQSSVAGFFGVIQPPPVLRDLLAKDPSGAGGISRFLSNGIVLIYSIASIVLLFMLLWGAFEWMTSGGDKEKLAGAQRRIINAVIGILIFAVAFAVIQVLGIFTGFTFFAGQDATRICSDGKPC